MSGSLINNRYVVTASHCVNGKDLPPTWKLISVRLGEWDLTTAEDCDSYDATDCAPLPLDVPVEEIIGHEEYDAQSKNQANDIALLRLAHAVQFNAFIEPICLPIEENARNKNYDGIVLIGTGWGKSVTASFSQKKLLDSLTGVNNNHCKIFYGERNISIINSQLCATSDGDSCRIDSGRLLMTYGDPAYIHIAGLLSFGSCGLKDHPIVFTRIELYVDWIVSKLRA